jgi:hypothetical protein
MERSPLFNRSTTPPDHVGVLVGAVIMMLVGWGGLYWIVSTTLPSVGPRWGFLVFLFMAVCGTVLPALRFLNVRFTPASRELPPGGIIVRQSIWVGLFAVTCAWLQMPRVLTLPIAFFLALAFVVIEIFLRSREIPNEQRQA